MHPTAIDLFNERFVLRQICDGDADRILGWRNSDFVRTNMFHNETITIEEHQRWFADARRSGDGHHLVFEYDEIPSGLVSYSRFFKGSRIAKWGFYLSPDAPVRRGLGLIMCYLGLTYGFESLQLHKIVGEVLSSNTPSTAIHNKLGFKLEGTLRSQYERAHTYWDVLVFGMLEQEWLQNSERIRSALSALKR